MVDRLQGEYKEGMKVRNAASSWRDLSGFASIQEKHTYGENAQVRRLLQTSCREALDWIAATCNVHGGGALPEPIYQKALPRSSTYEEIISFFCFVKQWKFYIQTQPGLVYDKLHAIRAFRILDLGISVVDALTQFKKRVTATDVPLVVARETSIASYFTVINPPNGGILTCAILSEPQMALGGVFRCKNCKLDIGNVSIASHIAANCIYTYTRHQHNVKLWYVELEHLDDCIHVKHIMPILGTSDYDGNNPMASVNYMSAAMTSVLVQCPVDVAMNVFNSADSSILHDVDGSDVKDVRIITSDNTCVPSGATHFEKGIGTKGVDLFNLESLFKGSYNLDTEYKRFCNAFAEPPVYATTSTFERDMQIQERTISLAAIMARRSCKGMTKTQFTHSMLATAERHRSPMDLTGVLRAFSMISLQRGAGSWHSIIRAPESESREEYMSVGKCVPLYLDVWEPLWLNGISWRKSIEPM